MGDPTGKENKNKTDGREEDVVDEVDLDQDDVEEVIVDDENVSGNTFSCSDREIYLFIK